MYENLLKTVTGLGHPTVLVAGDFMLDVYSYGDALRISPEAPVPVLRITESEYRCGGGASVAVDLAALGANVRCVGIIGRDPNAATLRRQLQEYHIDVSGLSAVEDRCTTTKRRLVGMAQHRHRQQLMRMDEESTGPLTDDQAQGLLRAFEEAIDGCDIVCLQDYGKGVLAGEICKAMIEMSVRSNLKVLVDPCSGADYNKYAGATVITPNRKEASESAGIEIVDGRQAAKAASFLAERFSLDAVVITMDRQGAYLHYAGQGRMVSTRPRSVYDVTGAGDIVLATLAVSIAAGADYLTAVQLSNISGGIEVEKFGAAPITIEELINEIVGRARTDTAKIRHADALAEEVADRRRNSEKIVFTNGCFDVIHRGHIEFLRFCRMQGDLVVVGLNSDRSVRAIKGHDRPINNQYDRAAVLAAMETVDYVTIFDEDDPLNLIRKIKPNVLVKGRDWADKGVVGADLVQADGGKVVLAPLVEGHSSTRVIDKIRTHAPVASNPIRTEKNDK